MLKLPALAQNLPHKRLCPESHPANVYKPLFFCACMNKSASLRALLAGTACLAGCANRSPPILSDYGLEHNLEAARAFHVEGHPVISSRKGLYEGYVVETEVIESRFPMNGQIRRRYSISLVDLSAGNIRARLYAATPFGEPVPLRAFKISDDVKKEIPAGHPFEQITPETLQEIYQAIQFPSK